MNLSKEAIQWLASGERGLSSDAMFTASTGIESRDDGWRRHYVTPADPDDLHRCRMLVESVPEVRDSFREKMPQCSPLWAALILEWDSLCAMMDEEAPHWRDGHGRAENTYKRMKALEDAHESTYSNGTTK